MTKGYHPYLVKIGWMHYFFIWHTGRNKPVLVEHRKDLCKQLIKEKVRELKSEIKDLKIESDNVYLGVKLDPTISPHNFISKVKAHTSKNLREKFPKLLKMPSLWTRSYFISTYGEGITDKDIEDYGRWVGKRK